jgi:tRNA (guanine-N7-)-methyltransferase
VRTRKKPWAKKELETNNYLIPNPRDYKNNWSKYFISNNTNILEDSGNKELHLEIGCGKGSFITKTAQINPDINYLALEREEQVIVSGMRQAKELELKNIGFILSDVSQLQEYFGEAELGRLYINFCDPWPNKKKWAKRRLTHANFLAVYKKLLKPGAGIFFKTDNTLLFEFSLNSFADNGWRLRNISLDLAKSPYEGNIQTEYEEKFSSKGMSIYRLEAYTL